jgi:hypothetical protein
VLPLIASIGTGMTEYEMGVGPGRLRLVEGVAMGVVLAIVVVALASQLRRPAMRGLR